jgi:hypothetical protein
MMVVVMMTMIIIIKLQNQYFSSAFLNTDCHLQTEEKQNGICLKRFLMQLCKPDLAFHQF